MALLCDMEFEFVDIIVKSDSEPTLASLIESSRTNSAVGSSKSNGIVERSIQSVQGMIRTIRTAIEEHRR